MRRPTNNAITQRKHGTYNAVDYSASPDRNIYAPEDGTILSYAYNGDCGNNLQMNGATGRHGFCHLESTNVRAGDKVKEGQIIGVMGYTGYTIPAGEGGRHLHWVINRNGVYVYPEDYVTQQGGTMSTTDLGIARVLAYGILGRNQSPNNALAGQCDADLKKNHVGKETNSKIWELYNSNEGKNWREKTFPSILAGKATAEANLKAVTADRDGLIKKLDTANSQIKEQTTAINELQITVKEQTTTITEQESEIKRLTNELSNCSKPNPDEVVVDKNSLWDLFKNFINFFKKG